MFASNGGKRKCKQNKTKQNSTVFKKETIINVKHRESHAWQKVIPPRRHNVGRSLQIPSGKA